MTEAEFWKVRRAWDGMVDEFVERNSPPKPEGRGVEVLEAWQGYRRELRAYVLSAAMAALSIEQMLSGSDRVPPLPDALK